MESPLREQGREPGLKLIETILWTGDEAPRWPRHLERLERSARLLGWRLPAIMHPAPDAPARLRLTLGRDGHVLWEEHPLPQAKAEWLVAIADGRLISTDPWLEIKSTHRPLHDAARAAIVPPLDEVIFLNERNEVCEGTITNLFFDRGEGLRTPPLSSGLLPGVLRAELNCPEEVLSAHDLPDVRLWVGNALRGLIPARLAAMAGH